jgi:hypothetical protein
LDEILQTYKFTNIYRELDTGTIWLREHIREPYATSPELFFNIAMYRRYNHWPFAKLLMDKFGFFTDYEGVRHDVVDFALDCQRGGMQVFTGAHMICGTIKDDDGSVVPSKVVQAFGITFKHLWGKRNELCPQVGDNLQAAFHRLNGKCPGYGAFISYEVVSDLRWTRYLDSAGDIMTWANPGPGCVRGLHRLASIGVRGKVENKPKFKQADYLDVMLWLLHLSKTVLPVDFPCWEMREVEHSLCEFDKYERVRTGEGRPRSKYIYRGNDEI